MTPSDDLDTLKMVRDDVHEHMIRYQQSGWFNQAKGICERLAALDEIPSEKPQLDLFKGKSRCTTGMCFV